MLTSWALSVGNLWYSYWRCIPKILTSTRLYASVRERLLRTAIRKDAKLITKAIRGFEVLHFSTLPTVCDFHYQDTDLWNHLGWLRSDMLIEARRKAVSRDEADC